MYHEIYCVILIGRDCSVSYNESDLHMCISCLCQKRISVAQIIVHFSTSLYNKKLVPLLKKRIGVKKLDYDALFHHLECHQSEILEFDVGRFIRSALVAVTTSRTPFNLLLHARGRCILISKPRKIYRIRDMRRGSTSNKRPVHPFKKGVLLDFSSTPFVSNSLMGLLNQKSTNEITGH